MKISRESRRIARELFRLSLVNDRVEAARVREISDKLVTDRPRGFVQILKEFTRLIRLELAKRHAIVDSAIELVPAQQSDITSQLTALFGSDISLEFRTKPEVIGGLRIQFGSDVWNGTVRAKLDALKNSL
jgi:F-type H+-transporting ATPase subunit delta